MKYFTVPLVGNAGDAFIFFKNTWHGRITSKTNINSESIFIGFSNGMILTLCFTKE